MSAEASFSPSQLGTKEHWDSVYKTELSTFEETGDEGEIWFGEEIVEKMRDWAVEYVPPSGKPRILDVGSGNGNLLFSLSEAGYDDELLVGIDYSMDAVRLAQSIASTRNAEGVRFACVDFLHEDIKLHLEPEGPDNIDSRSASEQWDLVLDKGTYDAITLSEKKDDDEGPSPLEVYAFKVADLVLPSGVFMITSCNFTEEELLNAFQKPELGLSFHSHIKHRTLTFGGVQGSTYTTVAFQKATNIKPGTAH